MKIEFDETAGVRRRRVGMAAAVAAVAALGLAAWWGGWLGDDRAGAPAAATFPWARADSRPGAAVPPAAAASVAALPPLPRLTSRPDALSAEEWAALQEVVKDNPDGPDQLATMVDFLQFQKKYLHWQTLIAPEDASIKHQLSRELLDLVVDKTARGMIAVEQARQIQESLIADIELDPLRREEMQRTQAARLPTAVNPAAAFNHP